MRFQVFPLLLAALLALSPDASARRQQAQPGQVQPVAPGTLPAPHLPTLTLDPPIEQVHKIEYLDNGFIEVAHAIVTVTPEERGNLRPLVLNIVQRIQDARPELDEVDISVYDKATYAGFGGPLPVLTASVPQDRLNDFQAWATRKAAYERVWVNPGNLPAYRAPDKVREVAPTPVSGNEGAAELRARRLGGVHDGLLYHGKYAALQIAALTFDDAPHPLFEPLLLDLLRRSGVRATFFVIGRNATAYPYFIRDMAEQGHEVANHTYHHVRLPSLPLPDAIDELKWANQAIQRLTGQTVHYFRPPGGDYTPQTLTAARELGLTTVFWTDDPGDFLNLGDSRLEARLQTRLRPGGIVLLHDNAPQMLDVLQQFLHVARRGHYTLTTLGGLPK